MAKANRESKAGSPPNRRRGASSGPGGSFQSLWIRTALWVPALVIAAIGFFLQDNIKAVLEAVLGSPEETADSMSGDAIQVVDVTQDADSTFAFLVTGTDQTSERDALAAVDAGSQLDDGWLRSHPGVIATRESSWEITLQSQRNLNVDIVDMRPVLEGGKCSEPLGGTLIVPESEGASDKISLRLEVDRRAPAFEILSDDGSYTPFFTGDGAQKITLEKDKSDTIVMLAESADHLHCRWVVEVDFIADGKRGQMRIVPGEGKVFELAGEFLRQPADGQPDSYPQGTDFNRYATVYYLPLNCPSHVGSGYARVSGAEASQAYTDAGPGCPPT